MLLQRGVCVCTMATTKSWNIVCCSDLGRPFPVLVTDPSKWTEGDLRREIFLKYSIPGEELTVYCNQQVLPEGKPLQDCVGLRNGMAVVAVVKPFVINVYSPDRDASLKIEIPRRELRETTVSSLLQEICFRFAFQKCENDVVMVAGKFITCNKSVKISEVTEITHNCLITYTRLCCFSVPSVESYRFLKKYLHVHLPFTTDKKFALTEGFFGKKVEEVESFQWFMSWSVIVQKFNGSKEKVTLKNPMTLPVFKLREAVKDAVSVPTHQQRLVLGETVLEDWDNEGEALLVTHYPGFYDGVTLYLIQLTEGIHVKIALNKKVFSDSKPPAYINIPSPTHFMINLLGAILHDCPVKRSTWFSENEGMKKQCNCKLFVCSSTTNDFVPCSNEPVSSVEWITDGCTLTLRRPAYTAIGRS